MFDIEHARFETLQFCAFWKALGQWLVVEVGLSGQWHICRTGGRYFVGEERPGDEPHLVAALDEVLGDRKQRRHVALSRESGDDDR